MRHLWKVIIVGLVFSFLAGGCERGGEKSATGPAGQEESRYLTVKGSDTMVHLVSTWAEIFMDTHKGSEVSITGGGSGTGIAALINGTTDICAASRGIKEKELQLAKQKGIEPLEFVVARDGIAVVVNPANEIDALSVEQIGKIFSGAYTRWSDVGGADEPVIVLSRESSSGTFVFFQEHVLNKADYTREARFLPGTSAVIQSVTEDRWATGYVGLGFAMEAKDRVKALAVQEEGKDPVAPSEETVRSGEYPIARPLYLYTNGEPKGLVKEFIDFCLSEKGQQIVRETGYVPL